MKHHHEWVNARDLKRQVRESAQRKKAGEDAVKRQSLNSSIEQAATKSEEFNHRRRWSWRDYALPLSAAMLILLLAGGGGLLVYGVRTWSGAHHSAWAQAALDPNELLAVEEHARQMIVQAQVGKLADDYFHPDIVPYWREKAQRILTELAQGKGVIEDVATARPDQGDDFRYLVYCRGEHGGAMILLGSRDGKLWIVKVSKIW